MNLLSTLITFTACSSDTAVNPITTDYNDYVQSTDITIPTSMIIDACLTIPKCPDLYTQDGATYPDKECESRLNEYLSDSEDLIKDWVVESYGPTDLNDLLAGNLPTTIYAASNQLEYNRDAPSSLHPLEYDIRISLGDHGADVAEWSLSEEDEYPVKHFGCKAHIFIDEVVGKRLLFQSALYEVGDNKQLFHDSFFEDGALFIYNEWHHKTIAYAGIPNNQSDFFLKWSDDTDDFDKESFYTDLLESIEDVQGMATTLNGTTPFEINGFDQITIYDDGT